MERQSLDCKDRAMRGFQSQTKWNCEDDDLCKQQVSSADLNATNIKPNGNGAAIRYKYFCSGKKETNVTSKDKKNFLILYKVPRGTLFNIFKNNFYLLLNLVLH